MRVMAASMSKTKAAVLPLTSQATVTTVYSVAPSSSRRVAE
jgi:hypothetical protein